MNQLYNSARQKFLRGQLDWNSSDIRLLLVDAQYTFNASHQFLSNVPLNGRIASADVPNESSANGYARGGSAKFTGLPTSEQVRGAILYRDTGVEGTSDLVGYFDQIVGFPFTPQAGMTYFVAYDAVFGGFFRL